MPPMRRARALLALLCVSAESSVSIAGAPASDIEASLRKANAYIEVSKMTERASESWERYQSWVDMKSGPTGKERYISYGMYDLHDIGGLLGEARAVAQSSPKVDKLDDAMTSYINAYEALAPIMNKASAYYDRKGYTSDNVAEGRALHQRMVPLAKAFLASRDALLPDLRAYVRVVEQEELAAIETRSGRSAAWHVGQVLHKANRVIDVFPRAQPTPIDGATLDAKIEALGPQSSGKEFDEIIMGGAVPTKNALVDVKKFREALGGYAEAVAGLNEFAGEKPDDFDEVKTLAGQMLDNLRKIEEPLAKSQGREFDGGAMMVGQIVNGYFEMFNTGNGMVGSQLRYLP